MQRLGEKAAEIRPVWDGYMADPFILPTPDGYYAYGTDAPDEGVYQQTGRHFPILFSQDLQHWKLVNGAVASNENASFWAPEVAEKDGRYYMYYSCGGEQGEGQCTKLAVADRPEGPFVPASECLFPSLPFSIDASPFKDPQTGEWYLFFPRDYLSGHAGTGLSVCLLGADMQPVGRPKTLLRGEHDWQIFEKNRFWYGRTWSRWYTLEGPCVVFREGTYYLFYSGGNWQGEGYGVNYATSELVTGPYKPVEDPNGAALLRSGMAGLRGPGHCSIFTAHDGVQYIVFHAWNAEATKRQMHIAQLEWKGDKPVVKV